MLRSADRFKPTKKIEDHIDTTDITDGALNKQND